MGSWRLEWVRMWRTKRIVALVATFVLLGLAGPIALHYLPELIKAGSNRGVQGLVFPNVQPVQGIANLGNNVSSIGTLVVAIVAAATLGVDSDRSVAAFYRSRLRNPVALILPRLTSSAVAAVAALALGALAAWYETEVLLGSVPFVPLVGGFLLESLWLCFVVAATAFFASLLRSAAGAAGAAVASILALAIAGAVPHLSPWLPNRLSGSLASLIGQSAGDLWKAVLVALLGTLVLSALAIRLFASREPAA
ncbi:MAG: hypothetical protein M0Z91_05355 [Actinomycetota bacterium]|nr:hypothetical protein [Actinomycetota bacterium]